MSDSRATLFPLLLVLGLGPAAFAENPPADEAPPLHQRIDQQLRKSHPQFDKIAAPRSTDEEFFRRIHLDLVGAIPTADETREFLRDDSDNVAKRNRWIDRLLSDPRHARRMQYVFDLMLMEGRGGAVVAQEKWTEYLRLAVLENKPWNEIAQEILAADGADADRRAPAKFYLDRNFDVDQLTRDVGRIFLGVDLECAQCHDHPAIDDYLQRHYYGISAFLKRSYLHTDKKTKKKSLGEKAEGADIKFTSVFTQEEGVTHPRLLNLAAIPDPKPDKDPYVVAPKNGARGVPKYSRRLMLAKSMVSPQNVDFRRNIANRLWALTMGRGLVEPLDVRHAGNPPSHPELLDLLADEFMRSDYNVRWVLGQLARTEAYQRSSRVAANADAARNYAVGLMKPLAPEQLAWSLMRASGEMDLKLEAQIKARLKKDSEHCPAEVEDPLWKEEALHKAVQPHLTEFVTRFQSQGGQKTRFDATAEQALFLINGSLVDGWLQPKPGNLIQRLRDTKDPKALAEELYLSVLSRRPSTEESAEIVAYLQGVERDSAVRELVWALLSSAEFRFNH